MLLSCNDSSFLVLIKSCISLQFRSISVGIYLVVLDPCKLFGGFLQKINVDTKILNMTITTTTHNFHITINVDLVALIFLDVANCSQISWKIEMFDASYQSTVFVDEMLKCT